NLFLPKFISTKSCKIKAFYSDVDNIIVSIKTLTVKNKTRNNLFKDNVYPPIPVVTKWEVSLRLWNTIQKTYKVSEKQ
ncbi:MAG: hypothetical protein MHPSP_004863, partial [Paramarteilia canceri]